MNEESTRQSILRYWSVQPPFKANEGAGPGSLEWYNSITQHRYAVAPHVKEHLPFCEFAARQVLEIGCGAGTDLCEFARNGALVAGVDITDTAVELTNTRFKAEGLPGSALKYDGRKLPFPDNSFDLVYSWGVLHHTPWMEDICSDAHRVLKSGGRLILMLYHRHSLLYYYSILYLRYVKGGFSDLGRSEALSRFSEFREGCPFTRVYAEAEAQSLLWYFNSVTAAADYCVYDTEKERKMKGDRVMNVERTGIPDIDIFFSRFNDAVSAGEDPRRFGWHLIVNACK